MRTRLEGRRQKAEGSQKTVGSRQSAVGNYALRSTQYAVRFTFSADLLLLFVGLLACWLTLLPVRTQEVDVGTDSTDLAYVHGTYQRESVDNRSFGWLSGDAGLELPTGQVGPLLLSLRLYSPPNPPGGALPMQARLMNGDVLAFGITEQQRVYSFSLPRTAAPDGTLRIALHGFTLVAPEDNRPIALALDRVAVRSLDGRSWPATQLVATEGLLLAAMFGLTAALRPPPSARLLLGAALVGMLCLLNLVLRMWIATVALPLALAALVLCALTLLVQPRISRALQRTSSSRHLLTERQTAIVQPYFDARGAQLLWGIVLAAAALRLLGVLSPGFEAHDLDVQTRQFTGVIKGLIFLTVHVHEWAGALTFYPPSPYLLLMPLLTIVPSTTVVLQAGAALLDAVGALLLALIARQLGASQRVALLAALLLAVLPVQFTALWWGFLTNVIGQVLVLLLVWALLAYDTRPTRRALSFVAIAVCLVLLSHVGVLLQVSVMLAGVAIVDLQSWVARRARATSHETRDTRHKEALSPTTDHSSPATDDHASRITHHASLFLLLLALGALLTVLYFGAIIFPMISEAFTVSDVRSERDPAHLADFRAYVIDIVPIALARGTAGLPALLTLPGLVLLWSGMRRGLSRVLLICWVLAPLLFFAVDVIFLAQVRYVYFVAPVCCLGTAAVLGQLWPSRVGKLVMWCAAALIVSVGVLLWLNGALLAAKPSLVPLTH